MFKPRVTTGKLMDVPLFTPNAFSNLHTYSSSGKTWGYRKLISHQTLFGSHEEAGRLKDSCLNIAMDVCVYRKPKSTRISEVASTCLLQRYQDFLGRQLNQRDACGTLILVSNTTKEFHVERSLLMAHSPVFAAMLTHDSKENRTSRCEMDDVDEECLEILLDYVYGCETGKIQGTNSEKVLVMADKYQMVDLRAVCEQTLANNITVDNAVRVFVLARQGNLGMLKDVAKKFIQKNMDLEAIMDD